MLTTFNNFTDSV